MTDFSQTLLQQAHELLPQAIALRRRIHSHPELGNELPQTRAAVLEALDGLDLDIHLSNKTSGIMATLQGRQDGKSILLRGDMDALPMPEDTGLAFASTVANRMHACGHDAHTSMLAVAARLLHQHAGRRLSAPLLELMSELADDVRWRADLDALQFTVFLRFRGLETGGILSKRWIRTLPRGQAPVV
jgi:metal-dependent amidase/aminoacylase/carboxypeptidase family protein